MRTTLAAPLLLHGARGDPATGEPMNDDAARLLEAPGIAASP